MSKKYQILLVEDDYADAHLIKKHLGRSGMHFEIKAVSDENGFMYAVTHENFDIILADHSLPQLTSFDLLRICKKLKSNVPFIIVSGSITEELAVNLIKEGADDYISKENLIRLPSAIKNAIANSEKL